MIFKNRIFIKSICLIMALSSGAIFCAPSHAQENSLTLALMEEITPMIDSTGNFNAQRRKWLATVREQNRQSGLSDGQIRIEELSNTCDGENSLLSKELLISFMDKFTVERKSQ
ncbi:MAG: hypothetical protein H6912_05765 [Kordiimonadaceae bacterium]|nr:hypothetical protein [Kordiimonadaceae bacterium]